MWDETTERTGVLPMTQLLVDLAAALGYDGPLSSSSSFSID